MDRMNHHERYRLVFLLAPVFLCGDPPSLTPYERFAIQNASQFPINKLITIWKVVTNLKKRCCKEPKKTLSKKAGYNNVETMLNPFERTQR
jgi:hypothetical protein